MEQCHDTHVWISPLSLSSFQIDSLSEKLKLEQLSKEQLQAELDAVRADYERQLKLREDEEQLELPPPAAAPVVAPAVAPVAAPEQIVHRRKVHGTFQLLLLILSRRAASSALACIPMPLPTAKVDMLV